MPGFEFHTPTSSWVSSLIPLLLPIVLLIGFFVWMQRRAAGQMGNVMSIGRSRAKAYSQDKPSTTFADIAGYEGVKQEIKEVVDFLRMPERFKEIGARVPKGMLLVGPPGTGKTLFARAVAGEAGVGFLSVTGSDFMEMFVGVGASRVRDLFQQARKMGRAIIFIDEIDSIGRKRGAGLGGGHDEREQTLNQMLAEMDGFETSEGIVIMAATNRPDILDPALLRPGRFDRQIVVPLPENDERLAILKVHSRDKRMGPDVDLEVDGQGHARHERRRPGQPRQRGGAVRRAPRRPSRSSASTSSPPATGSCMGARRESLVLTGRGEAHDRLPRGRPRRAGRRAAQRRPGAQGHDPARRAWPSASPRRCPRSATRYSKEYIEDTHLHGPGWPGRRGARLRPPHHRRRQRPRAGHRRRPPHGAGVGHERPARADGVGEPAARVPRRGPDERPAGSTATTPPG